MHLHEKRFGQYLSCNECHSASNGLSTTAFHRFSMCNVDQCVFMVKVHSIQYGLRFNDNNKIVEVRKISFIIAATS